LLNRYRVVKPYRGFESLRLRQPLNRLRSAPFNKPIFFKPISLSPFTNVRFRTILTGNDPGVGAGVMEKRLNAARVAATSAKGNYPDGGGLYLQVQIGADGKPRKSWLYRFTSPISRRERFMGLGSLDHVSLAGARGARDAARDIVRRGLTQSMRGASMSARSKLKESDKPQSR
jgi:hypothetical protein